MNLLKQLKKDIKTKANPQKAKLLMRFFKTGKGEYGEGDIFLGLMVPKSRELAKKYSDLDIKQLDELIKSRYHEERLIALFILVNKYKITSHKKIIFNFYLKHTKWINNWDLVDLSAHKIVGEHLLNFPWSSTISNPLKGLKSLAMSKNIWERRIAIISTFAFVHKNRFNESLKLAEILLQDKHDLIHKAVGWVLREVGKKDLEAEKKFLDKNYKTMPRTMLRYAIEKFPEDLRRSYLLGKI